MQVQDGVADVMAEVDETYWLDLVILGDHADLTLELQRFCLRAQQLMNATAVSLTLRFDDRFVTAAASHPVAVDIDECQYALKQGRCFDAATENRDIWEPDLAHGSRWPLWTPDALAAGMGCVYATPLEATSTPGALNVYGAPADASNPSPIMTHVTTVRDYAVVLVHNALIRTTATQAAEQLREAMRSRSVIEQAKGIIIAEEHVTADTAFSYLTRMSQASHKKLRDVATDIVQISSQPRS